MIISRPWQYSYPSLPRKRGFESFSEAGKIISLKQSRFFHGTTSIDWNLKIVIERQLYFLISLTIFKSRIRLSKISRITRKIISSKESKFFDFSEAANNIDTLFSNFRWRFLSSNRSNYRKIDGGSVGSTFLFLTISKTRIPSKISRN